MIDELGRKIMKEFAALGTKPYTYLIYNNDDDKKENGTKKCVIKRKLKFEAYTNFLKAIELENKINQLKK